jgi:hypothetical protein
MNTASEQKEIVLDNKMKDSSVTNTQQNYNLVNQVKRIKNLKQDTFESTTDFNTRVDTVIKELQNKVQFFAQNASKEYSAGTATMKSYDADREKMKLSLKWNGDLESIFPEIKNLQTVLLNISKNEAKMLFEKQRTHYFHIGLSYVNNKLSISEILIYNKYKMYWTKKKVKKNTIANNEVERLKREKEAMALELQKLKSKKTISNEQRIFQRNTERTLTHSQNNSNRKRRNYLYVCYDRKFLTHNKAVYNGCIRSDSACKSTGRYHFGKYPNDKQAHAAFIRCISSNPRFVDYQGL